MSITKQPSCDDSFEQGAITVHQAVESILSRTQPIDEFEKLHIRDVQDRVLHRAVVSPMDVPAHNNTADRATAEMKSRRFIASGSRLAACRLRS